MVFNCLGRGGWNEEGESCAYPFTQPPIPNLWRREDTMERVVADDYIYIFVGGVPRMGRIGKLIGFAN